MRAVVRAALASVRASPAHEAEQVSQVLLGEVVEALETGDGWLRCRSEDGFEGWVSSGALVADTGSGAVARWESGGGDPAIALDAVVARSDGRVLARLPWGARVRLIDHEVRLPDGRRGTLVEGRLVRLTEAPEQFSASGRAVVRTALEWPGVPYLWGGRTRWGADCSGFVQAVYRLHGFALPRDSYQQAAVGLAIDLEGGVEAGIEALEPGDLCFFRARDGERIVHVAISLGGPLILHSAERNGSIRENDLGGADELERSLAERLTVVRRPLASA